MLRKNGPDKRHSRFGLKLIFSKFACSVKSASASHQHLQVTKSTVHFAYCRIFLAGIYYTWEYTVVVVFPAIIC